MKKALTLLLAFCLAVPLLGGCKDKEKQDDASSGVIGGTDVTFEDTDVNLVADGNSPYSIVIPADAEYYEEFAASEFQNIFRLSTGITLNIVKDSDDLSLDGHYFSIGDTSLREKAGTTVSIKDKKYAFKIERKENSVIMTGVDLEGTVYAVYEYLEKQLGYEFFASDEIYVDTVSNEKLLDIHFEYAPYQAQQRITNAQSSPEACLRYRCVDSEFGLGWPHSHFWLLPPATYQAAHPDWYNSKTATGTATAICLTNDGVKAEMAARCIEMIDTYGRNSLVIGQQDTWDRCTCTSCKESDVKYGSTSGTNLKFVIDVAQEIKRLFAEQGRADYEFELVLLAYYQNANSPAVKNANGEWEIHPELDVKGLGLSDHFAVAYCPHTADAGEAFHSEKNIDVVNNVEGWKSITDKLDTYTYRGYFIVDEMMYMNDWAYIADWIKSWGEYGSRLGKWDSRNPSVFFEMRAYICTQLCYDVTQEPFELAKKFIKHYYKDAAPYVQAFFDGINTHMNMKKAQFKAEGKDFGMYTLKSMSPYLFDAKNWPQGILKQWEKLFEEAETCLENSTLSAKEKELAQSRLNGVSIFPKYWLLKFYKESYTASEYERLKEEVLNEAYMQGYAPSKVYLN